jgi:hypothetical protein
MKTADIIDKSCEITGLGPFPEASYHEGLDVLVDQINGCPAVTEKSLQVMEREMVASLRNRLRVEDYLLRHDEVLEQKIERPVFVFGIPRTGTTFTNHLLGADSNRRSLLNWEATQSVPPATSDTLYTDPRCIEKRAQQQKLLDDNPGLVLPHWEWADDPTECIFLLAQDFKALSWEARLPMPGYSKWILECDVTSAYEYHKKVLQVLQSKAPGIWNLKMPSHAIFVKTLKKIYPDARLIWTHRDPYQTFASSCSLNRFTQKMMGVDPDPLYIGDNAKCRLGAHLQGAMEGKKLFGDGAIYDIYYNDLMQDPIAEMKKLYGWLGDEFTPEIQNAMQQWIDSHPQNQFGKHNYSLAEFGESRESLAPIFGDYVKQYGFMH